MILVLLRDFATRMPVRRYRGARLMHGFTVHIVIADLLHSTYRIFKYFIADCSVHDTHPLLAQAAASPFQACSPSWLRAHSTQGVTRCQSR